MADTGKDIVNIRLSREANEVAERLVETGKFENSIAAAKFALAYTVKYFYDDFKPADYVAPDYDGNNYNIGSIDNDGSLVTLLKALYPGLETPFIYARSLMNYGLTQIGKKIEEEGMPSIHTLCM